MKSVWKERNDGTEDSVEICSGSWNDLNSDFLLRTFKEKDDNQGVWIMKTVKVNLLELPRHFSEPCT